MMDGPQSSKQKYSQNTESSGEITLFLEDAFQHIK